MEHYNESVVFRFHGDGLCVLLSVNGWLEWKLSFVFVFINAHISIWVGKIRVLLCSHTASTLTKLLTPDLWGFSPHQAVLWHQLGVSQFNSIWTLFPWKEYQLHKTAGPLQTPIPSLGCDLCFWPIGYKSVSQHPSLGLINLLAWFTELRKRVYILFINFL